MSAADHLQRLAITRDAGSEGGAWRITRERAADPARVLVGRTPQEAARLVPLVFNLCGAAHGLAAAAALGLPQPADPAAMARETVRDHALAILHHWPAALGEAPDRDALGLLARPGGDAGLAAALVGDAGALAAFSPEELDAWLRAAPTPTARRLAQIRRFDPAEGRAALAELTEADVTCALQAAAAPSPQPAAPLRETGALGRTAGAPLLAALMAAEGRSLFVRLLARLVDCLAALAAAAPAPAAPQWPQSPPGLGLAPAARGLLGHAARVEDGRVAAYRILSPSAWNLMPGGLLERAFAALSSGPQGWRLAPLLVSAINPCVPIVLVPAREATHA